MTNNFYTKQFSDDEEDTGSETGTSATDAYSFAGYTIEFNEKIAVTPVTETNKN